MGGATQSAVVTAVLASTVNMADCTTTGSAISDTEPPSDAVRPGTQCFSHSTDWLCMCSGESGICMVMLCAIAVSAAGGRISHEWLASASCEFRTSQHNANSHALIRLPGKRSECINCEIAKCTDMMTINSVRKMRTSI